MEIGRQVQGFLDTHLKQLEQFSKHMQAAFETQQALWYSMQKISEQVAASQERWAEFQKVVQRSIVSPFEELQRGFSELPPRTRKALLTLGAHGWYLDLDMPMQALWRLEQALVEGNVAGAEASLCEYFESRLEIIEMSLIARFPHRAHLISAAFSAHRREEYILSIPLLFAQTDGICKEVMGQYLFRKRNRDKKPRTAVYVEQAAADSFMAAVLSPLAQTLPINASEWEQAKGSDALNRHEVLHGTSIDYGTATNGLKAVSLINYVAHIARKNPGKNA